MKLYYIIIVLFLTLYGCDSNLLDPVANDSSSQADVEEARMALDDGDYDGAISILDSQYDSSSPDYEVGRILASAYMGKAGVDLTYILENADTDDSFDAIASALSLEITDQGTQSSSALFLTKSNGLNSNDPKYITSESINDLLENMELARNILENLKNNAETMNLTPEDDDIVQLGMASALHFIMKVGEAISEVTGYNVPVNKYAYQEAFPDNQDLNTLLNDLADYIDSHPETIDTLVDDLANVYSAVTVLIEVIGADDDISDDFDNFMRELLGLDADADSAAIEAAIQQYTGSQIADYIETELLDYN